MDPTVLAAEFSEAVAVGFALGGQFFAVIWGVRLVLQFLKDA